MANVALETSALAVAAKAPMAAAGEAMASLARAAQAEDVGVAVELMQRNGRA